NESLKVMDEQQERDRPEEVQGGKQRSTQNDTGLSFQEEPTGLERGPDAAGRDAPDPAVTSSHAAFTPGPAEEASADTGAKPLNRGIIILAVLILLFLVAVWLL